MYRRLVVKPVIPISALPDNYHFNFIPVAPTTNAYNSFQKIPRRGRLYFPPELSEGGVYSAYPSPLL